MLGHLGVNVADLDAARRDWHALMPLLGFEVFRDDADQVAYRPAGGKSGTYLFLYRAADDRPYSPDAVGLQHLAFMVPTRQAVREVLAAARALGGVPVHEPQVFPQYPQPYFAAFWRDRAGFTIEVVCHHDR
jgi:catechol 2,3-dioxygenase-like lactoylglutathione lyase family enzyme